MPNEFIVKNGLVVGGNVVTSGTITINGALAATQSWVTSQAYLTSASLTSYATQSYVTSAIASLVDSAPGALDTLRELATALGNDANFSTTITNSIASKQAQLNGTGLVRMSGTSVSYDNTTYLVSNFGNIEGEHSYGYPSSDGWYKIAEVVFNGSCQSYNLWGEYRDTGYFDNSHYRIHITARAECDFPTNNESHAINVNMYGSSTNETYFNNNVRVVLTSSSSNYRKYELQYYRATWDTGSWNLQTLGWTTYTTSQTAGTPTGTARVYYISKFVADNIYAANKISIGTTYSGFAANIAGTTYVIGASVWVNDGYGITNASSPSTGFLPYSDGTLVFNSVNSEKMRIAPSGNVGIGTNSPGYKLEVEGSIGVKRIGVAATSTLDMEGNFNFNANSGYSHVFKQAGSEVVRIQPSGNLGIGTASPTRKLDVNGTSIFRDFTTVVSSNGNPVSNTTWLSTDSGITNIYTGGNSTVQLNSNGVSYFNGGNVGIGTSSPDTPLVVQGGSAGTGGWNRTATLSATYPGLIFNSNGTKWGGMAYDYSAAMRFWVNASNNDIFAGTLAMSILNNGNVGIGTSDPGAKLHVVGNAWINRPTNKVDNNGATEFGSRVEFNNAFAAGSTGYTVFNYPSASVFRIYADYDGNIGGLQPDLQLGLGYLTVKSSGGTIGNVGIGTTAPTHRLTVAGGNVLMFPSDNTRQLSFFSDSYGITASSGLELITGDYIRFRQGSTELARLTTTGLGIGTSSPGWKLHVAGESYTSGVVRIGGTNPFYFEDYGGGWFMSDSTWVRTSNSKSVWVGGGLLGGDGGLTIGYGGTTPPSGGAIIAGNVGIGTASPGSKLSVFGNNDVFSVISQTGDTSFATRLLAQYVGLFNNGANGHHLYVSSTQELGPAEFNLTKTWGGFLTFGVSGDGTARTRALYVNSNGYVGVNVNPISGDRFEVAGSVRIHTGNNWDAIQIYSDGANGYIQGLGDETGLRIRSEYGNILLADNRGNVGIGTTTPQKKLDVNGTGIVASFGTTISPGAFAGLHFGYSESASNNDSYKKSALVFERTDNHGQGGNASGKIHFLLNNIASASATSLSHSVMVIDTDSAATQGSARVGIGTTSPSTALTVNGVITATGGNSTNWNTAYSWGNHATAGYLTSVSDIWVNTTGDTMSGTLSFQQPVGLSFANGQYIKDNNTGGLIIYSGAAVNINGTSVTINGNTVWHAGNDGSGSGLDADTVDGIDSGSFLRSDVSYSFSGTLTMATQRAFVPSNYGHGVYGLYSAERYQHVWSMGAGYDLPADGVSNGNGGSLYGLAWSYNPDYSYVGSNAQSKPGLNHQLLLMMNGITYTALGNGIWTSGTITTTSHGNSSQWNTAYSWGNHASAGYQSASTAITTSNIGSQSVSYANSAGYAGYVNNQSGQLVTYDNRTISPSETNAGYLQFGFTSWDNNGGSPYADYLHMRSYTDGSGGNDNLVMFLKSGIGMRIYQQTFGSATAYSSYADVWTSANFTSTNVSNWNTAYSWGNHASQSYATTSYVTTQINNLIAGAPGALDTLDELAAALGDDSNFATTVTNSIAGKVSKAGDTMTGALTLNAGLNAYASPIYVNEIRFRDTAGSPASDPYSMRWVSESSTRGAGLSWLEFQLNDDNNEEIRIYGNSCVGYGCGATSENLYHRFRADGYAWHGGNLSVVGTITASGYNDSNWNTAYGWGNHASAGYALNSSLANYLPLSGGVIGGGVTINGNLTVNGTITENSSLKLKENVETSEGNLEKVVNLRPVTYNKIGSQTTELGLIAEEVAEVYPEFVQYDENGEPVGVHYSRLTAALIGAVKELTNQVQELNKKING